VSGWPAGQVVLQVGAHKKAVTSEPVTA